MKTIKVKAGSIVAYKCYSIFEKLWYKIINKPLKYNLFDLCPLDMEVEKYKDFDIFEPVKSYSRSETHKAVNKYLECITLPYYTDVLSIVNYIRPNTISDLSEIANSKFYKKIS